jgi:hypothetical protein
MALKQEEVQRTASTGIANIYSLHESAGFLFQIITDYENTGILPDRLNGIHGFLR